MKTLVRVTLVSFAMLALIYVVPTVTVAGASQQPENSAALSSFGGAPVGSPFLINDSTFDLENPAAAYDSALDHYWVVAQTWYDQSILANIKLSRSPVVVYWSVAQAHGQVVQNPDIAYNIDTGKFLVVWEHNDGTRNRIKARLMDINGPVSGEFELGTPGAIRDRYRPAVAYASTGKKFLVVWESVVWQSGTSDIEAQVVSNTGAVEGSNFLVAVGDWQFAHYEPDLAYNRSRNEYLVAWSQDEKAISQTDIFARRVTATGTILDATPITIGYHTTGETAPAVAAIPTSPNFGMYLVAWELHYSATDHDIYTRAVSGLGVVEPVRILTQLGDMETHPAVAGNESVDLYLVTWTAPHPAPFINVGIHGRPVALNGDITGTAALMGGLFADNSTVICGPGGDFMAAYQDPNLLAPVTFDLWGRFWGNWIHLPLVVR